MKATGRERHMIKLGGVPGGEWERPQSPLWNGAGKTEWLVEAAVRACYDQAMWCQRYV